MLIERKWFHWTILYAIASTISKQNVIQSIVSTIHFLFISKIRSIQNEITIIPFHMESLFMNKRLRITKFHCYCGTRIRTHILLFGANDLSLLRFAFCCDCASLIYPFCSYFWKIFRFNHHHVNWWLFTISEKKNNMFNTKLCMPWYAHAQSTKWIIGNWDRCLFYSWQMQFNWICLLKISMDSVYLGMVCICLQSHTNSGMT